MLYGQVPLIAKMLDWASVTLGRACVVWVCLFTLLVRGQKLSLRLEDFNF